jgi:inosine-uridine nucleoside N-ribohydrolase
MMTAAQKIMIDTDPGHDDAMALMLACKSPELDVLAVTTVCGNSTIENTTRNARYILDFIGQGDIPVYSGAAKPLTRDLIQAVVHGASGLEGIDPQNEPRLTDNAVDQILRLVKENPRELTIVALGPLTNVALAIQKDPGVMRLVKQIVAMGGAIETAGNKNRVAEFNIFVDPEAADIVMRFPVPKILVPLDTCNHVQMRLTDFKKVTDTDLQSLLVKMMRLYIANLSKDAGVAAALMYDPLTVFYLLQPESCKTKPYNIQIETAGEYTRGMTVADRRTVTDGLAPNVTVVTDIQASDFVGRFIDTLNGSRPAS